MYYRKDWLDYNDQGEKNQTKTRGIRSGTLQREAPLGPGRTPWGLMVKTFSYSFGIRIP